MSAYIAILRKDARSDYSVEFPDLPGCVTAGKTLEEARQFARGALALHLQGLAEDGEAIPAPSTLDALMADPANSGAVAFLVEAPPRKPKAVPVTITVTEDLVEIIRSKAAELGMSQSGLFAASVRQYLGLHPDISRKRMERAAKAPRGSRKLAAASRKRGHSRRRVKA